jgi:Protein of unknown function (DUF2789)
MDGPTHQFSELFTQLGLPADGLAIRQFLAEHTPLPSGVALADAPFWTPTQAAFLREQWLADADWTQAIDHLGLALAAKQA